MQCKWPVILDLELAFISYYVISDRSWLFRGGNYLYVDDSALVGNAYVRPPLCWDLLRRAVAWTDEDDVS